MTKDLMLSDGADPSDVDRRSSRAGYAPLPWLSQPGQVDRRNEASHAVTMREMHREYERERFEIARRLALDLDEIDADSRLRTEMKFRLHRAKKESDILGEDAELRAKFGVLDDDQFVKFRAKAQGAGS